MYQPKKIMQGGLHVFIEKHEFKPQARKISRVLAAPVESALSFDRRAGRAMHFDQIEFRNSELRCGFLECVQGPGRDYRLYPFHWCLREEGSRHSFTLGDCLVSSLACSRNYATTRDGEDQRVLRGG
jgi:hypothetical protein